MPDSSSIARLCGDLVDISPIVDGYFGRDGEAGAGELRRTRAASLRRGNFMARTDVCPLRPFGSLGGLVVGTGNKTEALIGYSTLFRRLGLCVQPHRGPVQEPVRQVAAAMEVPEEI